VNNTSLPECRFSCEWWRDVVGSLKNARLISDPLIYVRLTDRTPRHGRPVSDCAFLRLFALLEEISDIRTPV
jgi:hypothetical protein